MLSLIFIIICAAIAIIYLLAEIGPFIIDLISFDREAWIKLVIFILFFLSIAVCAHYCHPTPPQSYGPDDYEHYDPDPATFR